VPTSKSGISRVHQTQQDTLGNVVGVKRTVTDVECKLLQINEQLATIVTMLIHLGYQPKFDTMAELHLKYASYYQGLIGVLCWITELSQIDILIAVVMLSQHSVAPR
jgi:hypothetical protein